MPVGVNRVEPALDPEPVAKAGFLIHIFWAQGLRVMVFVRNLKRDGFGTRFGTLSSWKYYECLALEYLNVAYFGFS